MAAHTALALFCCVAAACARSGGLRREPRSHFAPSYPAADPISVAASAPISVWKPLEEEAEADRRLPEMRSTVDTSTDALGRRPAPPAASGGLLISHSHAAGDGPTSVEKKAAPIVAVVAEAAPAAAAAAVAPPRTAAQRLQLALSGGDLPSPEAIFSLATMATAAPPTPPTPPMPPAAPPTRQHHRSPPPAPMSPVSPLPPRASYLSAAPTVVYSDPAAAAAAAAAPAARTSGTSGTAPLVGGNIGGSFMAELAKMNAERSAAMAAQKKTQFALGTAGTTMFKAPPAPPINVAGTGKFGAQVKEGRGGRCECM